MKDKIYFIDFLNVRYSYRHQPVSSILSAFDKTLRGNCRAYFYCIPFGKGYDNVEHINVFYLPEGEDDDRVILDYCEKSGGFVVSRDKFRNYPEYKTTIQNRHLSHRIRNGRLKLVRTKCIDDNTPNYSNVYLHTVGGSIN